MFFLMKDFKTNMYHQIWEKSGEISKDSRPDYFLWRLVLLNMLIAEAE